MDIKDLVTVYTLNNPTKAEIIKKMAAVALEQELHQERSLIEMELGYLKPGR